MSDLPRHRDAVRALNVELAAELRRRHTADPGQQCPCCGQPWPCDGWQLADAALMMSIPTVKLPEPEEIARLSDGPGGMPNDDERDG